MPFSTARTAAIDRLERPCLSRLTASVNYLECRCSHGLCALSNGLRRPMDSQESSRIAAPLARRLGEHADAMQIAEAIVVVWGEIDKVLAPIIGHGGVIALYKRSLYLTAQRHTCLTEAYASVQSGGEFADLKPVIEQQTSITVAIGDEVFQLFEGLLVSLIGNSLTERLLSSVWENALADPPAQEPAE